MSFVLILLLTLTNCYSVCELQIQKLQYEILLIKNRLLYSGCSD